MTDEETLAAHYFDLSNQGRLTEIQRLFTAHSTYSSTNAGVLLGADAIMAMQRQFFAGFNSLSWQVHDTKVISPGVVLLDFTFSGEKKSGETIERHGLEYVVVHEGSIVHVEVRDKP